MQSAQTLNISCRHCGLLFSPRGFEQFCCHGCESVFDLLQAKGLGHFYDLQISNEVACPIPAKVSNENFAYCDDPFFINEMSHDQKRMSFYLEGLNCTACLWLLEKTPDLCSDCESIQVRMSDSIVEVTRKEGKSFARIAQLFDRFGYTPHVVKRGSKESVELKNSENRKDLIRIGVAAGCTGNIMILAVSLYAGATGPLAEQFRLISALLAIPVLSYCSWPFYKSTIASIRNRHLNLDVPIVGAIVAGAAFSVWGLIFEAETLFFDSLSMLIFLLLSSRYLLKRIQQAHLNTSNLTSHLLLTQAERKTTTGFEKVSSLALNHGDIVRFRDATVVSADGEVISGSGLVNTATLTGEALPHSISRGDMVFAGTRVLAGDWLMRVEKPAAESRLSKILEDVRISSALKPKIVKLADQAAQWFVVIVFSLAAALLIYFSSTDVTEGISRALALIIVTCPCVFGMAIPLSMSLAIKKAAERGIIIKDGDTVERLTHVRSLFVDKTGTLTEGNLEVLKVSISPEDKVQLPIAEALERNQSHPVARAIVRSIEPNSQLFATNVRRLSEGGISGTINDRNYRILPAELIECLSGEIKTRYNFFCENNLIASFDLGDKLRPEAGNFVTWARSSDLLLTILSGDRNAVVNRCAKELGLPIENVVAQVSPEQKAEVVAAAGAHAAMIGDGANDAAALAAAGVGIAVSGSIDLSLRAADVYLTKNSLIEIKNLFSIAANTKKAIKRNLKFSLLFNVVAGSLAIAGAMTPLWAAILMPLSSLTVLLSSLHASRNLTNEADPLWK